MNQEQRPSIGLENQDWKLSCFLDWQAKQHREPCSYCSGRGEVGGGFGSIDGPTECPTCYGNKTVSKGPTTPKPPIPQKLLIHMRRAWEDFFLGEEK